MSRGAQYSVAALVALLAVRVEAAACCVSASAFGLGRLAVWEQAAGQVSLSTSPSPGRWDEHGVYFANAPGTADVEVRPSVSGLISLHERWQLAARVPWVVNSRQADGYAEAAHGVGDALASVRFEALHIGEYDLVPGVALNLGLTVPSGLAMARTQRLLATDVTGRGAWVVGASVTLEQTWRGRWYAQLAVGATVPLPMASFLVGQMQRFGPTLDSTLAVGVELGRLVVVSCVARGSAESSLRIDERIVPNSSAFDLGVGPAVAWKLHPRWTVQAGLDTGLFIDGLGDNRPARVTFTAGVRHAFF